MGRVSWEGEFRSLLFTTNRRVTRPQVQLMAANDHQYMQSITSLSAASETPVYSLRVTSLQIECAALIIPQPQDPVQLRPDRCAPIQPARPSHIGCASVGAAAGRRAVAGGYAGESIPDRLGASDCGSTSEHLASAGGSISEHMRTGEGARDTTCRSIGLRTRTAAGPGDIARVGLYACRTGP